MLKVLGLDHVVIRVKDVPRMTAFSRDVLGCEFKGPPNEG